MLLGIVDANYNFLYVDIGCQGRISDGGVFKNTSFYEQLMNNTLGIPDDTTLPGKSMRVPYVFVTDEAFGLQEHMKPYPGIQEKGSKERIFNYRLSRARRVVENSFGILSAVFRILRKPILLEPSKASIVIQCCVYLHNFLKKSSSRNIYMPQGSLDEETGGTINFGNWRESGKPMSFLPFIKIGRKPSQNCQTVREEFADYFMTDIGSLPWQTDYS